MQTELMFSPGRFVAGVDEAGRGPLAGPVVAAAVILDPGRQPEGLRDSKRLTIADRDRLAIEVQRDAVAWAVAWADRAEIDAVNILNATLLAMRRAILGLRVPPDTVLVDGNRLPDLRFHASHVWAVPIDGHAVIGGDDTVPAISAASILAKTTRDAIMCDRDRLYPDYAFSQHKGYATLKHRELLRRHGPCDEHRRSFAPVRECTPP